MGIRLVMRRLSRLMCAALPLLALSGCAVVDPYASSPIVQRLELDDAVGYCARLFADVDRRIDTLGVRDVETSRIAGFPYLRVDRFSAALANRAESAEQQQAWRTRLQRLDESARATELANAALAVEDLARCRALLASADQPMLNELRSVAKVPDDYSVAMRALGLYPLTRLPFAAGIARWHKETLSTFSTPLDALRVQGRLQRYAPPPLAAERPSQMPLDALGVPLLSPAEAMALLIRHAPILEIDAAGAFDQPGALMLDAADRVAVDGASPVVYTRVAHTLIDGSIYPQLVYTFWFGERPSRGTLDLLAGRLDGVVWRVTVDRSGEALVYDSMHACGCYHLFFPTVKVRAREAPSTLDEGLFVPQTVRASGLIERVVLRIESGTHYLQRVRPVASSDEVASVVYALQDERAVAILARQKGGTRSAFGEDGLIAGSERAERWFFWPMGIKSAGQMRQWGHHATAFVGRRHFDDPLLFNDYFEIRR